MSTTAKRWPTAVLVGATLVVLVLIGATMIDGERGGTRASATPPPDVAAPGANTTASCKPTEHEPDTGTNYNPDAPLAESLGQGFVIGGVVRSAADCARVSDIRIQIWLSDDSGYERENQTSVRTDDQGRFRLETGRPATGPEGPHVHAAYDGDAYRFVVTRRDIDPDSGTAAVDLTLAPRAD